MVRWRSYDAHESTSWAVHALGVHCRLICPSCRCKLHHYPNLNLFFFLRFEANTIRMQMRMPASQWSEWNILRTRRSKKNRIRKKKAKSTDNLYGLHYNRGDGIPGGVCPFAYPMLVQVCFPDRFVGEPQALGEYPEKQEHEHVLCCNAAIGIGIGIVATYPVFHQAPNPVLQCGRTGYPKRLGFFFAYFLFSW